MTAAVGVLGVLDAPAGHDPACRDELAGRAAAAAAASAAAGARHLLSVRPSPPHPSEGAADAVVDERLRRREHLLHQLAVERQRRRRRSA